MPTRKRVNVRSDGGAAPPKAAPPRSKPKLGQNFLRDRAAAERIVAALGDVQMRTVVEIGPGHGILTELLAARAMRLMAIELDRVLAAQLRMKYARRPNVEIIEADVLAVNFVELLNRRPGPLLALPKEQLFTGKADVVGNLPYYITSDILLHLFEAQAMLDRVVVMVQREVADRMSARAGGSDYGLLSATTQLHARVEQLFTLPPDAFSPPPQVFSTVVRLTISPQWERLRVPRDAFLDFLKLSFGQKRKTLVNNLKEQYRDAAKALKQTGVREDARAETLTLDQAAAVFRSVSGAK
ncbi:MAG TPA: 16S rRNA (adenine(1518)-N(6)/adenine(1519)-N(6))-dimethyltransferase RsmA [Terriglobales bacterium]|nr:16S rRNA (adenine(1518)-N(6)/adenine(1519)-N(6))-dimethyltransferase RsmA [Terriglobales bacterium]